MELMAYRCPNCDSRLLTSLTSCGCGWRAIISASDPTITVAELIRLMAEKDEEIARLKKRVRELEVDEMWNAYHSGIEKPDGSWTHAFMSDGEWLVAELGFDPGAGWYESNLIKAAIHSYADLEQS